MVINFEIVSKWFVEVSPLLYYVIGMTVYSIVIWHFYRHLAHRDLFELNLHKYDYDVHPSLEKFWASILYILEFLVLLPIYILFWFLLLTVFIIFLSKSQNVETILLLSMALITTTRVISYFNHDLAKDIAKLLPLILLGVFVVDPTIFNINVFLGNLLSLPDHWHTVFNFMIFVVVSEAVLRMILGIFNYFRREELRKPLKN